MSGTKTKTVKKVLHGTKTVSRDEQLLDRELDALPLEMRWREWMLQIEAVIFAATQPVTRDVLARVIGEDCALDRLIEDLREELRDRPYDLLAVAGGWQFRTKPAYRSVIATAAIPVRSSATHLSEFEAGVMTAIAYMQPVTRSELSKLFGKEIRRDIIATLRDAGWIVSGPRSPSAGAPYTYVTTKGFLSAFGFNSLRDLPDMEALEDAGLLKKETDLITVTPHDPLEDQD